MLQTGFVRNVLRTCCQMKGVKKMVKKYGEYFYILIMSHRIFYLREIKIFTALYTFTLRCMALSETEGKKMGLKREIKVYFSEYGHVT